MRVRPIEPRDRSAWAELRASLWPDADADELAHETIAHFAQPKQNIFVAEASDGRLVGFLELSLRAYAEGCVTSPVPFIEGWYVTTQARGAGVGRALVEAAENWARMRGFREIASDTEAHNAASQAAHDALGYAQVETIVCFRKPLDV